MMNIVVYLELNTKVIVKLYSSIRFTMKARLMPRVCLETDSVRNIVLRLLMVVQQESAHHVALLGGVDQRLAPRAAGAAPVVSGQLLSEAVECVPPCDNHLLAMPVPHELN